METTRDDQVIYFKDLIFTVLYQWRKVLCFAVIFAVLFGGFQTIKLISGHSETQEAYEEQLRLYEENVIDCQENIEAIEKNIEVQKAYLYNSLLLKLNPYRVYVGNLVLNIKTDPLDPPSKVVTLLDAYSKILDEREALAAASEELQVEIEYLRELVSLKYNAEGTLLTVTVLGDNEDMVNQLINTLTDHIAASYKQVKSGIGNHTVAEVFRTVSYKTMLELEGKKTNAEAYLKTLEDSLKAAEKEKNSLVHPWNNMLTKKTASMKILRDAAIGGVLGAMLMAVLAVVLHIFRKRVYSAKTLKNRTGVKVLGCIPAGKKKKAIDRLLMKWDGRTVRENRPLLLANLQNYYRNAEKILVTGIDTAQAEMIAEDLTQAGMPGIYCGSLVEDAQAVAALASCDGVLIVAECYRTGYASIRECCEMIEKDKTVGCILING